MRRRRPFFVIVAGGCLLPSRLFVMPFRYSQLASFMINNTL